MGGKTKRKRRQRERFFADLGRDVPSFSYPKGARHWHMPFGRGARRLFRFGLLFYACIGGAVLLTILVDRVLT